MLLLCSTSPHLAAALLTGEKQFITLCWTSAVVSALSGHEFSAEVCSTRSRRFPGVGKNNKKVAGRIKRVSILKCYSFNPSHKAVKKTSRKDLDTGWNVY